MTHTSLGDSKRIDGGVRPAMSFNRLVPIQCNRRALREDNSGIHQAGEGIEHDKGPEESLPSPASRTVAMRTTVSDMYPVTALPRTYNSRFRNKLIEIFTKTVEMININSAIRMSMILYVAACMLCSRNWICRPIPCDVPPMTKPITTKVVACSQNRD